jgi:hypothetical protein
MGLKSSHWSCLKACFKGYTFCFTTFLVRPSTGAQRGHERPRKKRSNDLERSKFRQQVRSFGFVHPWSRVTFKFWELLKNGSEVALVPKKIFSKKMWTWCQVVWSAKVSLADGTFWRKPRLTIVADFLDARRHGVADARELRVAVTAAFAHHLGRWPMMGGDSR